MIRDINNNSLFRRLGNENIGLEVKSFVNATHTEELLSYYTESNSPSMLNQFFFFDGYFSYSKSKFL